MIVGVGAIGKRHFQSLIKLNGRANFYLVDPKFKKIKTNQIKDFLGVNYIHSSKKIFLYKNLNNWIEKKTVFNLCIISTNSDNRMYMLNRILSSVTVKNIILEKFLFNKLKDYRRALNISELKSNSIYVNQWISQSSNMRKIFYKFKNYNLDFKVSGTEWGMASNIVHFIDMIRFFKIRKNIFPKILKSNLDPIVYPAKRNGFFEVYGDIAVEYGKHILYASCYKGNFDLRNSSNSIDIEIKARKFKNRYIKLNLKSGRIKGMENFDRRISYFSKKIELMSELTGDIFKSLNKKKKIYLPDLKQSAKQHLIIFKLLSRHFKKVKKTKNGICPIT